MTRYGISEKAFPHIDISNLSRDDAIFLYQKNYWDKMSIQYMPKQLRLMIFDCAVNQGVARAALFLQRACGVSADGVIGAQTLRVIKDMNPAILIESVARQRLVAYIRHPKWSVFGAGWASRLLDITIRSLT